MTYKLIPMGGPVKVLFVVIPCYILLSWSSFRAYKAMKK